MSWAITSFGNEFCVKKRLRLIKALDNGFYVKFMQLEIGLLEHIFETQNKYLKHRKEIEMQNHFNAENKYLKYKTNIWNIG